jgi:hypothetical protein
MWARLRMGYAQVHWHVGPFKDIQSAQNWL